MHVRRKDSGRHRIRVLVEGLEDTFCAREVDNDMSDSEIEEHVVAAVKNIRRRRSRRKAEGRRRGKAERAARDPPDELGPLSPSPGCGCSVV